MISIGKHFTNTGKIQSKILEIVLPISNPHSKKKKTQKQWFSLCHQQDGNEVFFKIKRSTQLKKLMNAYYDRQSMDFNSIAFLFNGRRLRGEQTPNELEMEDGDEIDAMLHQTSGTSA
uniref:Small ubiquitin-related modifier n=1 Tax=Gossypium raimondii TaxID=29730 RepID=A0A0D2NIE8_GOSRA|nr:hypothetical protein B456_002G048500 [Gossypium raimondii]